VASIARVIIGPVNVFGQALLAVTMSACGADFVTGNGETTALTMSAATNVPTGQQPS
jgi:hypothetical protein